MTMVREDALTRIVEPTVGAPGLPVGLPQGIAPADAAQEARRKLLALRQQKSRGEPVLKPLGAIESVLSFGQEGLWFVEQLGGPGSTYHSAYAFHLAGAVDADRLGRAFDAVVERHQVLRSALQAAESPSSSGPAVVSRVVAQVATVWSLTEATMQDRADRAARVNEWLHTCAHAPFDLSRAPLLRASLLRLGADEAVLSVVVHHIAFDGPSLAVLLEEVSALYAADTAAAMALALPALPLQYADYAAWQRQRVSGALLDRQLSYWRDRLQNLPTLDLPTDRPRPTEPSQRGAIHSIELPAALGAELKALAQRQQVTLFMLLLAAFQVLLTRASRQDDVAVGIPVGGRGRTELEGLIGYFVNSLVLRSDLGGNPRFSDVLEQVRQAALAAYAHADLPFDRLVAELRPERDPGRHPLYQVSFALNHGAAAVPHLDGVQARVLPQHTGTAKFELSLTVREEQDALHVVFEYACDLFDPATIEGYARQWQCLLRSIVAAPHTPIGQLAWVAAAEQRRLLDEGAGAVRVWPPATACQLIEAQVCSRPEALAVRHGTQSISYRELNGRANRLAHRLRSLGVGPEVFVGVCLPRTMELPIAVLAVMKAGGVYLPLDPQDPPERRAFMREDCAAPVLLTHSALRATVGRVRDGERALWLDEEAFDAEPDHDLAPLSEPEHLAYVIYTSGSTGRPKGVLVPQRGLANHVQWLQETVRLGPDDRVLHKTSIGFDASLVELIAPLACGAAIVLADEHAERDTDRLVQALSEERITVLQTVPSALRALLAHSGLGQCDSLRYLVSGGEALDRDLARQARAALPMHTVLGNFYGPTEASIDASQGEVQASDLHGPGTVPIGRAVANARCLVLDEHLQPVPQGQPGELFIGGVGLARGYLNQPELTAERFVPDPWREGERLYRSGDLVRRLADGRLDYLGRIDSQVKLRGYRIELGEIEAALNACEGVQMSAVVLREERPGHAQLVGYFSGEADDMSVLREALRKCLPEHMLPTLLVRLAELPRLPNGKLDRKALPAPPTAAAARWRAPRTPVELSIAALWCELLGIERVGIDDHFFELGGHSLLVAQLISRLRAQHTAASVGLLFRYPTLAGFAAQIEALDASADGIEPVSLRPVPRDVALPLSFAQESLWFIDQLGGPSAVYNVACAWHLSGEVDESRLRSSLATVMQRHESLRTAVQVQTLQGEADGRAGVHLSQDIRAESLQAWLAWWCCEEAPHDGQGDAATAWLDRQACRPFDLGQAPLLRAGLLRLKGGESILSLVVHHLAFDGVSLTVLMDELSALYAAGAGMAQALPAPSLQYADYAVWQRRRMTGALLERQIGYWRERLSDLAPLDLPTDHARPAQPSQRGALHRIDLGAALGTGLRSLAQRRQVTLFQLMLAAFQVLLMRVSRQTDVAIGIPVAGRSHRELEGLIGYFVNSLVLRVDLGGNPRFADLLERVRQATLDAYAHADLPFDRLVAELRPPRELGRHPLYQVSFDLRHGPEPVPRLGDVQARALPQHTGTAKFDLSLTVHDELDTLHAVFEYACDLFEPATIEGLGRQLRSLLHGIVAAPETAISQLPRLDAVEQRSLLEEGEGAGRDWPVEQVLALVAARVREAADAEAVRHGAVSLSYGELDRRSHRLAHRLRALGVGPEVFVGVCLPRGLELPVAVLAVLKAGGVYLPLDPLDPPERRAFMREDCAAAVLLTHSSLRDTVGAARDGEHRLWLDEEGCDAQSDHDMAPPQAHALAYVIYTSGSTGRPKGVLVPHRGLANHVQWIRSAVGLGPQDRVLHKTSIGFDASLVELIAPLACGATIVLADEHAERDTDLLVQSLRDHRITVLQTVPSALRALLAHPGLGQCDSLRYLISGGEALERDLARQARAILPAHTVLGNFYGPTEASIDASFGEVQAGDLEGHGTVPIGRAVANARCLVLDEHLQPVPSGLPGELCIGGAGLARGYLNQPELTAERFVADPWREGERLYRSGDLVRRLVDGRLEYLGRIDQQIKLRGLRIELGEVEAALNACEGVQASAVVLREERPGHAQLVGYVTGDAQACEPGRLREALRRRLPEYMLPALWVNLPQLPRLPNGKLDRKALPPLGVQAVGTADWQAPGTPLEQSIAALWCELLGVERVGIDDHFFELGGHSLLAAQLLARLRPEHPGASLAQLFKHPTLAGFAAALEALTAAPVAAGSEASRGEVLALQPHGDGPALFCICGVHLYQKLADGLAPERPVYGVFLPYEDAMLATSGSARPLPSVGQMAADYLREIRRKQPSGPYHLLGVSFGGLLAYEMAQQLRDAGEAVGTVTLVDYHVPRGPRPLLARAAGLIKRVCRSGPGVLLSRWQAWRARHDIVAHHPQMAFAALVGGDEERRLAQLRDRLYLEVSRSYELRPYAGPLHLLRAEESLAADAAWVEPGYGWHPLVEDLRIEDVPGGHLTMLAEPHVGELAGCVRRILTEAESTAALRSPRPGAGPAA